VLPFPIKGGNSCAESLNFGFPAKSGHAEFLVFRNRVADSHGRPLLQAAEIDIKEFELLVWV
jgi:hypothetical protein